MGRVVEVQRGSRLPGPLSSRQFLNCLVTVKIRISNATMFYCNTPDFGLNPSLTVLDYARFVHVGETFNRFAEFGLRRNAF